MPYYDDMMIFQKKKEEIPEVKVADLKITNDGKIVNKNEVVKDELYNRHSNNSGKEGGVVTNREFKMPLTQSSAIPGIMKTLILK